MLANETAAGAREIDVWMAELVGKYGGQGRSDEWELRAQPVSVRISWRLLAAVFIVRLRNGQ